MSLGKISKQPQETWSALHRRVTSMKFDMEMVFPSRIAKFVTDKAHAISTCPGYVIAGLISTVAFLSSLSSTVKSPSGQVTKTNLFQLVCGPPSTGKSQAIKDTAIDPVSVISSEKEMVNPIIQKTTSAGLAKKISTEHSGYIVSTEIFDCLFKLLKGDGDASTGDTSLFCELFSGEQVLFNYATMATKEIPEKISFGILGCIQMFPLAKIVTLLDQGHGLLERFLITVPLCLRPTPTQTKEAKERLSELPPVSYADIGSLLCEKLTPGTEFHFSDEASELINKLDEDFINEINEAISNGHVPPKSKRIDLLVRVSVAIHIITILTTSLLDGVSEELLNITSEIPLSIVEAALYYVDYCENQKAILSAFVMDIVATVMDSPRTQPSSLAIKLATLLFPGKAVTYRSLRGSGSRSVRGITVQEFETAINDLKELGKVTQVRVPRSANKITIFLKKVPGTITSWPEWLDREQYIAQFEKTTHSKITGSIRDALVDSEGLAEDYFD